MELVDRGRLQPGLAATRGEPQERKLKSKEVFAARLEAMLSRRSGDTTPTRSWTQEPKAQSLKPALYSLLKYSTISAWLQSTGPMNLRRIVPSRSMI